MERVKNKWSVMFNGTSTAMRLLSLAVKLTDELVSLKGGRSDGREGRGEESDREL